MTKKMWVYGALFRQVETNTKQMDVWYAQKLNQFSIETALEKL